MCRIRNEPYAQNNNLLFLSALLSVVEVSKAGYQRRQIVHLKISESSEFFCKIIIYTDVDFGLNFQTP